MITVAEATVLQHVAENQPISVTDMKYIISHISGEFGYYIQLTDEGFIITDTGRLALEEYEGAQTADAPDELAVARARIADQQGELEARGAILNLVVTAAQQHNGWLDSINHLAKLAYSLKETRIVLSEARIAELEALLSEAAGVLAPFVGSANDSDVKIANENRWLLLDLGEGGVGIGFPSDDGGGILKVKHLRAIADFAARLKSAGVK